MLVHMYQTDHQVRLPGTEHGGQGRTVSLKQQTEGTSATVKYMQSQHIQVLS